MTQSASLSSCRDLTCTAGGAVGAWTSGAAAVYTVVVVQLQGLLDLPNIEALEAQASLQWQYQHHKVDAAASAARQWHLLTPELDTRQ